MFHEGDVVRVRPDLIYKKKYSSVYTNLNMWRWRGREGEIVRVCYDHCSGTYRYQIRGCYEIWGKNHLELVTREFVTDYDDERTSVTCEDLLAMVCCVGA